MIPWDWFHGRIKFIYDGITPDSLSSWLMCAEYVLLGRDPRRNQVFLDCKPAPVGCMEQLLVVG